MTASSTVPDVKQYVMLIDLSALYWQAWHASADQEVSAAGKITMQSVRRCVGNGDKLVAICCDSKRSFRKELFPAYKSNRPEKDHQAIGELERVKERLSNDGFLLWEFDGYEADDVIATATMKAWGIGHDVTICSGDKDLLQLVQDGVAVLRTYNNWDTFRTDEVIAKFGGIRPIQVGDWLALAGDGSDGIKGAPGVGPKTATDLLLKHETLDKVIAAAKAAHATTRGLKIPATVRSIVENEASIRLGRELIGLRQDVPLEFEQIYEERQPSRITEDISYMKEDQSQDEEEDQVSAKKAKDIQEEIKQGIEKDNADISAVQEEIKNNLVSLRSEPTGLPVSKGTFERSLAPSSIANAYNLAKGLHESRLYQRFQNAEAIMAVIMRGREIGLGAMTSLDCWHVIEGKPAPHAWLIIARAKADPDCEYFQCTDRSATSCTWETKNKSNPKPTKLTYTIDDARRAGLIKDKSNWEKRPAEMLCKTAGVQLARLEYPTAAMGMYSIEEISDGPVMGA